MNVKRYNLNQNILTNIEKCIFQYDMLKSGQEVLVGFSGGKDSTYAALALRELGYNVQLASVDMGYDSDWTERINKNAQAIGFTSNIVNVCDKHWLKTLGYDEMKELQESLFLLKDKKDSSFLGSPCTKCYNSKIIILGAIAKKYEISKVVFGHHADDMISSFLKSGFMYIDRWDYGNEIFNRNSYESIIEQSLIEINHNSSDAWILKRVETLMKNELAGTDEPPIQTIHKWQNNIDIIRPLIFIHEHEIINECNIFNLKTELSNCGHGDTKNTETPREMIHNRILKNLHQSKNGEEIFNWLHRIALLGILPSGRSKINVRNCRTKILGPQYRAGWLNDIKL